MYTYIYIYIYYIYIYIYTVLGHALSVEREQPLIAHAFAMGTYLRLGNAAQTNTAGEGQQEVAAPARKACCSSFLSESLSPGAGI